MQNLLQPESHAEKIRVVSPDAFRSLYEKIGCLDQTALIRKDVRLCECKFLERSSHIDAVIIIEKSLV